MQSIADTREITAMEDAWEGKTAGISHINNIFFFFTIGIHSVGVIFSLLNDY
jgi:hypothetical protein